MTDKPKRLPPARWMQLVASHVSKIERGTPVDAAEADLVRSALAYAASHGAQEAADALGSLAKLFERSIAGTPAHRPPGKTDAKKSLDLLVAVIDANCRERSEKPMSAPDLAAALLPFKGKIPGTQKQDTPSGLVKAILRARRRDNK